jgi:hypothetical protein
MLVSIPLSPLHIVQNFMNINGEDQMVQRRLSLFSLGITFIIYCPTSCLVMPAYAGLFDSWGRGSKPERTVQSYEKDGAELSKKLKQLKLRDTDTNNTEERNL